MDKLECGNSERPVPSIQQSFTITFTDSYVLTTEDLERALACYYVVRDVFKARKIE